MQVRSDVLRRIKIHAEDELLERIVDHPIYRSEIAALVAEQVEGGAAARFFEEELGKQLRTGTELTRATYDVPFRLLDGAVETLQLDVRVRLFKSTDVAGAENATIVANDDRVLITFQSGLLTLVNRADQLLAIIGHELGHHGFGHLEVLAARGVYGLLDAAQEVTSGPGRRSRADAALVRLVQSRDFGELLTLAATYSQVCELNCDRAGLLVQPDLTASIEGEMLLSSGPADSFGRYESRGYLAQGRELVSRPEVLFDLADLEATHPVPALRALAMEFFYSSDLFREITGHGPATERLDDFNSVMPFVVPVGLLTPRLISIPRTQELPRFLRGPHTTSEDASARALPPTAMERAFSGAVPAASVPAASAPAASAPAGPEGVEVLNEEERAELSWLLGLRIIGIDGKVTAGEEAFMTSLVRPRALGDAVASRLMSLTEEQIEQRSVDLFSRARRLHGRTKTVLVKMMIQAAKADRKITDDEVRAIADAAEALDAAEAAARELRNVFGSRADAVLAGTGSTR